MLGSMCSFRIEEEFYLVTYHIGGLIDDLRIVVFHAFKSVADTINRKDTQEKHYLSYGRLLENIASRNEDLFLVVHA